VELTELETVHDVPVLRVTGDVDLSTAAQLRAASDDLLARRAGLIVIDLSEVSFLDSAGLKVLDEVQQQALDSNGRIALVCSQRRLLRLLEITGLDERFPIHATPESAATAEGAGA
jgi:anti-sigma B factor antagonist